MAFDTDIAECGGAMMPHNGPGQIGSVESEKSRAMMQVQAQVLLAKQFPRDEFKARDQIMIDCGEESLARRASYAYPKGKQTVSGPSIRLLETIARRWGNIESGVRILHQSATVTQAEAYAWDMETNNRMVLPFQTEHKIALSNGGFKVLTDPREIYELVANFGARRRRTCLEALIPRDLIDDAAEKCEETLRAKLDCSPTGIQKMLNGFSRHGVTKEDIEARLKQRLESIKPGQMAQLFSIFTSLKDGMSVPADWFPTLAEPEAEAQTGPTKTEQIAASLKKKSDNPFDDASDSDPGLQETVERNRAAAAQAEDQEAGGAAAASGGSDLFGGGAADANGDAHPDEDPEAIRADITLLLKNGFPTVADGSAWMRKEYGVRNANEAPDDKLAAIRTALRERPAQ